MRYRLYPTEVCEMSNKHLKLWSIFENESHYLKRAPIENPTSPIDSTHHVPLKTPYQPLIIMLHSFSKYYF